MYIMQYGIAGVVAARASRWMTVDRRRVATEVATGIYTRIGVVNSPPTVLPILKSITNHYPVMESGVPASKTNICMQSSEVVLHPPLAKCDP